MQRRARRSAQCAAKKPCQPKTAKRIFGGPGSHGPSGQAKERTRILPVRRGSFCPACRAIWQAGRSCAASRCCGGLCARYFCRCAAALFPACAPLFCRLYADFCACLSGLRCRCPPCALFWLFVHLSVLFARVFSFVFHLFLPNFFLSNFFSFVAQAATGISLLVPSRGFVSGLCGLSPAAFSRPFAPVACLPVLRCSHGFSPLFFCPFLPNFFLSNFFSFVAQAATGLYFLPKRK